MNHKKELLWSLWVQNTWLHSAIHSQLRGTDPGLQGCTASPHGSRAGWFLSPEKGLVVPVDDSNRHEDVPLEQLGDRLPERCFKPSLQDLERQGPMILLVVRRLRIPEDLRHVSSLASAVCSSRRFPVEGRRWRKWRCQMTRPTSNLASKRPPGTPVGASLLSKFSAQLWSPSEGQLSEPGSV